MMDWSRRRTLRAGGALTLGALAGCSSLPSGGVLQRDDGGGQSGPGAAGDDSDGWADGPHDLPLSVRATGDDPRSFRVVVRTDEQAVIGSGGGPATDATFSVPADGERTVEAVFPVPDDGRVVYSALLREDGVVVGSRAVEVPTYHTAHAVEADVYDQHVDWRLRVH